MPAATAPATESMHQLTLDAGGATVDTSKVGSIKWSAETRDLDRQFTKGDDVELRLVCRVVGVPIDDKYDAHGNVAETIRKHTLRVDDLEVLSVGTGRFKLAPVEDAQDD